MAGTWSLRQLFSTTCAKPMRDADTQPAGEVIEIGDFEIDMRNRRATLRANLLDLTVEEFDVLVFLTVNPQRFVTPQTMLSTQWADGKPHQTEFLRILLALQRKLQVVVSAHQYLRTEPWVVYRFDPGPFTTT